MLIELKKFLTDEQVDCLFDGAAESPRIPEQGISYFDLDNPVGVELGVETRKYYASDNLNRLDQAIRDFYLQEFQRTVRCRYGARRITYQEDIGCPWHNDFVTRGQQRECSVIFFLTDPAEYEGGQLEFKNHEPPRSEKGDLLIYSPDEIHGVTPVTKGTRQVLVLFYYED